MTDLEVELERLAPDDGDVLIVRTATEPDDRERDQIMASLGRLLEGVDVKLLFVGTYALQLEILTDDTLDNLGLERVE